MAAAVPYIIAAVSSAVGVANHQRTLRKQNDATVAGLIKQQGLQDEANARVGATLDELKKSGQSAERAQANQQFMTALQRSRAAAAGATPEVLGANSRYSASVDAGRAANASDQTAMADNLSQIMAPSLQRQGEGVRIQDLGLGLNQISGRSRGQDFLTRLRVNSIQDNPWLTALQQAGSSAASAMSNRSGMGSAGDTNAAQWGAVLKRNPGTILNDRRIGTPPIWQGPSQGVVYG